MAGQKGIDDVSFGDAQGPLAYWGPGARETWPAVVSLSDHPRRNRPGAAPTAAVLEPEEECFGDLCGPLSYWGPGSCCTSELQSRPREAIAVPA